MITVDYLANTFQKNEKECLIVFMTASIRKKVLVYQETILKINSLEKCVIKCISLTVKIFCYFLRNWINYSILLQITYFFILFRY